METRGPHWRILTLASAGVVASLFVVPRFVPAPQLYENRPLAPAPTPPHGPADLARVRRQTDAWVADHLPARPHLIAALNRLRMLVGVSGTDRVIVGREGWLYSDDGTHLGAARNAPAMTAAEMQAWLDGLASHTETLKADGITYVVLVAPVKEAVYPQHTPAWFRLDLNRPAVTLSRLAHVSGAGAVVYPAGDIGRMARYGLNTYTPHETHWTGLGAYLGYVDLMRELQRQGVTDGPRPLEAFQEQPPGDAPPPRNLALMLGVASFVDSDYPQFIDEAADRRLRVTYLSDKRDWTAPRVVDTGQTGKPVLLMGFDSFSMALLPFLYGHFSRVVLAQLGDGPWRPDLIARYHPDVVVTEVIESGLTHVMWGSPPASPEAAARIAAAVADRQRYAVRPPPAPHAAGGPAVRTGSTGDDVLEGRDGPDDLRGLAGNDTVHGRGGEDVIRGGRGDDVLFGDGGDDWISGGRGRDTLSGGAGADIFNTFVDAGDDVVLDFNAQEGDRVEIDAKATPYDVRQVGADTVVTLSGATLTLKGVKLADLPPGWIGRR